MVADKYMKSFNAVLDYYNSGRITEAKRMAKRILGTNPDCLPVINLLGCIKYQEGKLESAIKLFSELAHLDPKNATNHYQLGLACLDNGETQRAIQILGHASQLNPSDIKIWIAVSRAYQKNRSLSQAENALKAAIQLNPQGIEANLQKCRLLLEAGKLEEAVKIFRRLMNLYTGDSYPCIEFGKLMQHHGEHRQAVFALKCAARINPDDVGIRNLLSFSLEALGDLDEALRQLRTAQRFHENDPVIFFNIGILYQKKNCLDKAIKAYQKSISIDPYFADAYNSLSIAYRKKGNLKSAFLSCGKALSIKPNFAEAFHQKGLIYHKIGKLGEAEKYYQKAIEQKPNFHEAYFNLGNLLKEKDLFQKAVYAYQKAIQLKPDFHEAMGNMGNAFMLLGNDQAAISAWEKAIAVKPGNAQAYAHIATLRHFEKRDRFVVAMEALLADPKSSVAQKILLSFALAKAYENLDRYDRSFQLLAKANQLKRNTFEYDETATTKVFESVKHHFNQNFIKESTGCGFADPTPIFIIGMPRSGTTLVEQILSSHPDVFGAGELSHLDEILTAKCKGYDKGNFPAYIGMLKPEDFKNLGLAYVRRIRKKDPETRYITDKMPHNFLFIGMIKLILPAAKIIHCRRHPMDTCFSIFKNNFEKLHRYSYDLQEISHYYCLYQDLMNHWSETLNDSIYDIDYEKLVSNPDCQVRALIEYCDLNWDDRCLHFHRSRRPVRTASTAQVRRPFYKNSVNLWRKYEKHLCHLQSFLGIKEG